MVVELRWLGYGFWEIKMGGVIVFLDFFLIDLLMVFYSFEELDVMYIFVLYGYFDYVVDVVLIVNWCDLIVIVIYEIVDWFVKNYEVKNVVGMNFGGNFE